MKSLWRQKALYFAEHDAKPRSRYIFDKVLHTEHYVSPQLLCRRQFKVIMMLRVPERSIKSIVSMYRERQPEHQHAQPEVAAKYYLERVKTLTEIGAQLAGSYLYVDSESIIERSEQTL